MSPITTSDGHNVPYVIKQSDRPATANVILAHGITVDKNEYNNFFVQAQQHFCTHGFNVIRFDYRGHGDSSMPQEDMTIEGEYQDIKAVSNYMQRINRLPQVIVGTSFGAISSIILAANDEVQAISALVLWNPVLNVKKTFPEPETQWAASFFTQEAKEKAMKEGFLYLENFKVGKNLLIEMMNMDLEPYVSNIKIPVIAFHGDKDDLVPYKFTIQYSDKFKNFTLKTLEGCGHGFIEKQKEVIEETAKWISSIVMS